MTTESFSDANDLANKIKRLSNKQKDKAEKLRIISRINKKVRYYQPENKILDLSAEQAKTDAARDIYLSNHAIDIIESVPPSICGRLSPGTINTFPTWLRRILAKPELSDIVDLHWHDLRHEGTTRYFEKGLEIQEVQLSTGHASLESLQRYIEITTSDVVEKLGQVS